MKWLSPALAGLLVAPAALADTPSSYWERIADPGVQVREDLHREADALLHPPHPENMPMAVWSMRQRMNSEVAIGELEEGYAQTSADVRLRIDLGFAYKSTGRYPEAIAVLVPALHMDPAHPASLDGWWTLAEVYARQAQRDKEDAAYMEFLKRVPDNRMRATGLLNHAEAQMGLLHLREAIASYQEAFDLATDSEAESTRCYALYGLSVATDRYGDSAKALEYAKRIRECDVGERIIQSQEMAYFVPAYERSWYIAMAFIAHAKMSDPVPDPRVRYEAEHASRYWWEQVRLQWAFYVKLAEQAKKPDPWLALARLRLKEAEAQLIQRAPKDPGGRRLPATDILNRY